VYRKQEVSCKTFCAELEEYLDKTVDNNKELVVVGDFNVWADVEDDRDYLRLLSVMNSFGLSQLIHEPTHKSGHTLDHVYINQHSLTLDHLVHDESFGISTDHFPCTL
jgi:endonuclease/exonuclease/phosphatase (EEP) superfamily protein YafD